MDRYLGFVNDWLCERAGCRNIPARFVIVSQTPDAIIVEGEEDGKIFCAN